MAFHCYPVLVQVLDSDNKIESIFNRGKYFFIVAGGKIPLAFNLSHYFAMPFGYFLKRTVFSTYKPVSSFRFPAQIPFNGAFLSQNNHLSAFGYFCRKG
jgi:hypothetical protein